MAPTVLLPSLMAHTPGRASIRPTISQTAAMHRLRRLRPEAITRLPAAIALSLRAITEAQAITRPPLPHKIRVAGLMATSSNHRTSKTVADTAARRKATHITDQIKERARPRTARE